MMQHLETILRKQAAATLRLGPMRRELYARGELTPELKAYTRLHRLDVPAIEAHAGMIAVCLCKFYGGNSGERVFQFDTDGVPAAVVEALAADGHGVLDLVAWRLDAPDTFATAIREADVLGALHMVRRGGRPLHVFKTPLAWLRAGCDGCVVLNQDWGAYWLDKAVGPFVAEDVHHGFQIREMLGDKAARHRVLVPANKARAA